MDFKPMLGTELPDKKLINFPVLVSPKLDGIRCIFHPKLGMVSRSLKQIPNKQLQEKFKHLIIYSEQNNIILDGELYKHDLSFQQITSLVMTKDFNDEKTYEKLLKKDEHNLMDRYHDIYDFRNPIQYHCFDILKDEFRQITFEERNKFKLRELNLFPIIQVQNELIENIEDLDDYFKNILELGYEGLIVRNPESHYKFGRSTPKEQGLMKYKPWNTYDSVVIGIVQEQESIAESKKNELGQSSKSHKKEFMRPINRASAFEVMYNGHKLKVSLAMTHEEREYIWKYPTEYMFRMIEYKGMDVGAKNVPRHPVFIRFREDKDNL